jgi:hypothetical protein
MMETSYLNLVPKVLEVVDSYGGNSSLELGDSTSNSPR